MANKNAEVKTAENAEVETIYSSQDVTRTVFITTIISARPILNADGTIGNIAKTRKYVTTAKPSEREIAKIIPNGELVLKTNTVEEIKAKTLKEFVTDSKTVIRPQSQQRKA